MHLSSAPASFADPGGRLVVGSLDRAAAGLAVALLPITAHFLRPQVSPSADPGGHLVMGDLAELLLTMPEAEHADEM